MTSQCPSQSPVADPDCSGGATINQIIALDGVAQFVGHLPANQMVVGSISSRGTCLNCGFGPNLGSV